MTVSVTQPPPKQEAPIAPCEGPTGDAPQASCPATAPSAVLPLEWCWRLPWGRAGPAGAGGAQLSRVEVVELWPRLLTVSFMSRVGNGLEPRSPWIHL